MKELLFATNAPDPWCPGCGHTAVTRTLQHALERHFKPSEVVLVSDIGCIGMADSLFTCHTVHGLHGRAPALAAGIALSPTEHPHKVVAVMGDGGAAIGLQHILECARLNVDLTLIVCNNQNYGMTGGQHSAYTLVGVKTHTTPQGAESAPFPLCEMVAPLGVLRARTMATGQELARTLDTCLTHRGFSLIETLNYCPSYAGKLNPDTLTPKAMEAFFAGHGLPLGLWPATTDRPAYHFQPRPKLKEAPVIPQTHGHALEGAVRILLAGSAGEGVQSAAEVFAQAAMRAGLHVVVKGEYPVTVGKGFSSAFVLLSSGPIGSPATERWDHALVSSGDGLKWIGGKLGRIATVTLDASLALPEGGGRPETLESVDLRRFGAKQASFAGLVGLLRRHRWFPEEALREAVAGIPGEKARQALLAVLAVEPEA